MEDSKQKIIDSLKQATNILVTVKASPTIDALAACIALTLVLNELGKHGTAVFSGEVPSVLEFLEPGKTLERNTDSLRDFIISLDKAKADKLRYKVEDSVVKIFITPYKTSISEKDLDFGQGDFNVDVVVALGVHNQDDLDEAITTHGRILHDATVISMDTEAGGGEDLGTINWIDANASSLSEMVASIANELGKEDMIDNQVATALLTGIVSETERFGNAKTTPDTMKVAAELLTAGANQELVATKLNEPPKEEVKPEESEVSEVSTDEPHEPADDVLLPSPFDNAADNGDSGQTEGEAGEDHGGEDKAADEEPPKPAATPGTLEIEHSGEDQPADVSEETDIALMPAPLDSDHGGDSHDEATDTTDDLLPSELTHPEEGDSGNLISTMPQPLDTPAAPAESTEPEEAPADTLPEPETQAAEPAVNDDGKPAPELTHSEPPLLGHHTVIQPLHSEEPVTGEPPKPNLDETKFALTPPSMGGTLTANESDMPAKPAASDHPQILKHDTISQPTIAPVFDTQAAEAAPPATMPLPTPTIVTEAQPPQDEEPQTIMASPLLGGPTPPALAAEPAPVAPGLNPQTLSDIEQSVGSTHVDGVAPSPTDAVMQPAPMPQPVAANLIPSLQMPSAPGMAPPAAPPPIQ